jgi:hypothetical protein
MNEKIKLLAEQAGLDYMPDHDLEKFAQLIAAECAGIAETAEPYQSSDLIKQHFGVKK